jgi:hypothetical protein
MIKSTVIEITGPKTKSPSSIVRVTHWRTWYCIVLHFIRSWSNTTWWL